MKRKSHLLQNIFVAALTIIMILMSVGFAAYQQELKITGQTTVAANKWSVHFGYVAIDSTDPNAKVSLNADKTVLDFGEVKFNKPNPQIDLGDRFLVYAYYGNDGTFDARVTGVTMEGIPAEYDPFIVWGVTESHYEKQGESYAKAGSFVATNHSELSTDPVSFNPFVIPVNLPEQYSPVFMVTMLYRQPEDPKQLPQQEVKIHPRLKINVEQV